MAEDKAIQWIVGFIIYFVFLIVFLAGINEVSAEYSLYDNEVITSTGSAYDFLSVGSSICANPRSVESIYYSENNPSCEKLMEIGSVYDEESCNSVRGCNWEEKGYWSWPLFSSTFVCDGYINDTAYNNGVDYSDFTIMTVWTKSVCGLENLSYSENLCETMGCTWYSSGSLPEVTYKKAPAKIWNFIKNIITLRVQFHTGIIIINTLLNLLLIWIPLLIMMMSFFVLFKIG